ncbi:MarR family transcriptional regulator [Streptomyces sp. ME02-6991-2B]|nr:MarR family transcriptional regulator [Streptomyces sp. ME02-6991-2B]
MPVTQAKGTHPSNRGKALSTDLEKWKRGSSPTAARTFTDETNLSTTLLYAAVNAEGVIADLDLPPAAYRVLLKLRSLSEPGGRIEIDQGSIAELLRLSRPSVNAALRALALAKLVRKRINGVYELNPMLAGYVSPADCVAAINAMNAGDRLDDPGFIDRYRTDLAADRDQPALQRTKIQGTAPNTATSAKR